MLQIFPFRELCSHVNIEFTKDIDTNYTDPDRKLLHAIVDHTYSLGSSASKEPSS
jgi:hypothetical protein